MKRPKWHSLRRWWADAQRATTNVLFPPWCLNCGSDLAGRSSSILICQPCLALLVRPLPPQCPRCAARVPEFREDVRGCPRCRDRRFRFAKVITLGEYDEALRVAVLRTKAAINEALAAELATALFQAREVELRAFAPDVVVPVPLHWRRRLLRQINNAEVMANRLARLLGVPMRRALRRRRSTRPQGGLGRAARFENVRGCMRRAWFHRCQGRRVLLVDDIMTTGATCGEAAKTLRRSGAAAVVVAVIARAHGPT